MTSWCWEWNKYCMASVNQLGIIHYTSVYGTQCTGDNLNSTQYVNNFISTPKVKVKCFKHCIMVNKDIIVKLKLWINPNSGKLSSMGVLAYKIFKWRTTCEADFGKCGLVKSVVWKCWTTRLWILPLLVCHVS